LTKSRFCCSIKGKYVAVGDIFTEKGAFFTRYGMVSEANALEGEAAGHGDGKQLRIGTNLLTTSQVAERERVSTRTVERWVTKQRNALPALRVTAGQMRAMGYGGNLYPSPTGVYFLIKEPDLALIPSVRGYPKNTKRPNRVRKGTITGAGAPDRQP
jgi:hypothetical protein